jgi:tetratricopeptide (TPR) repeat protein
MKMAAKKNSYKKELSEPERILSLYEKIQGYILDNSKQVAIAGVIICVVAVATGMWVVKQRADDEKASLLLSTALNTMVKSTDNIVDMEMNYNKALDRLKILEEKYPGTTSGRVALFYMGVCNYSLKKYDEAISGYDRFLQKNDKTFSFLQTPAYECIGYCYEGKGEHEKALEYFTRQRNSGNNNICSMAALHMGNCYEKLGQTDKACNAYQDFLASKPSAMYQTLAQIKTSELCKKKEG